MVPVRGRGRRANRPTPGADPLSPPLPPPAGGPATVLRLLRFLLAVDPGRSALLLFAQCLQGLIPAAVVWTVRYAFAAAVGVAQGAVPLRDLLLWLALWAGLQLLDTALWPLADLAFERLRQEVEDAVQLALQRKAAALRLEVFERPDFHDVLRRASEATGPGFFLNVLLSVLQVPRQVVTLLATVAVVAAWSPWLLAAIVLAALPDPLAQISQSRAAFFLERGQTAQDRLRQYLGDLLTAPGAAKEVRAFGLAGELLGRWSRLYRETADARFRLQVRQDLARAGLGSIGSVGVAAGLGVAAAGLVGGSLQAGQFAAMLAALQGVQAAAAGLMHIFGGYFGGLVLRLADLFVYLDLGPEEESGGTPPVGAGQVEARAVTFRYPLRQEPALQDVSCRLRPGERVALVGENGSGKTTLVKLLLGLYRPTAGRVLHDGRDVQELDPSALRALQAAVFQDHGRYAFTLGDNIGYGRAERLADREAVEAAAGQGGADEVARNLPAGYDTLLTRRFSGGTELSGGQWQRVAVSRGFMRQAPLLVLDEPTAALDPMAEADVFRRFVALAGGRTALLVSHRLGLARLCDRVLVLSGGRLVEQGTHEELLARGGEYARLWALQAGWYR